MVVRGKPCVSAANGWAVVGRKNEEAGGGGETDTGSFSQYVVHVGNELASPGVVS